MGLFDAFSASQGTQAANRGYQAQKKGLRDASNKIEIGTGQGVGALGEGRDAAYGFLGQGYDTARADLQGAMPAWDALAQRGNAGVDYYGQLVGLPGSGGAGIQQTLQSIPGYQFAMDQGLEGLNRSANARGMLQSGNNTQDILRFSQGLADQNYFNYLNSLNPYFGLAQSAAAGKTGISQNLADTATNFGANRSNVATGTASNLSNLYTDQGRQLAALAQAKGQAGYQQQADITAANNTANQNLWGAILGLAGAGANAYAGYAGGGK